MRDKQALLCRPPLYLPRQFTTSDILQLTLWYSIAVEEMTV